MSLLATLRAIVLQIVAPLDLYALYPAQVVSQNDDGSVEIKPTGERANQLLVGLSRVPIRGLPGVRVEVAQGARVLVGWEGGDASAPYAALMTADSLKTLTITADTKVIVVAPEVYLADEEGAQPLARVGDLVEFALPPLTPFTGTVVPAPPGSPVAGTLTFVETAQGYITSGSSRSRSA